MNIGVISDTHGDSVRLTRAYNAIMKRADGYVDAFFHCGDYALDTHTLATLTRVPIYTVFGNCDMGGIDCRYVDVNNKYERVVELKGKRFFLTHGHMLDVNTQLQRLACHALEHNCDMAIFGHTHIPCFEAYGKLLILNPGSPTRPLGGSSTSSALITIDDDSSLNAVIISTF